MSLKAQVRLGGSMSSRDFAYFCDSVTKFGYVDALLPGSGPSFCTALVLSGLHGQLISVTYPKQTKRLTAAKYLGCSLPLVI